MPNITEFTAGNLAIRPSETGVEAAAQAGRRIGAFYDQEAQGIQTAGARIGQSIREAGQTAVEYADHQQIEAGAKHGADLTANLIQSWNQTAANADPHDPTTAQKWRTDVLEKSLDEFVNGSGDSGFFDTEKSKQWASEYADRLRQHFYETTEGDMGRLAKIAASDTVHSIGNQFSNTALSDPTAVPMMLSQVDHSIESIMSANPNIKGQDVAEFKLGVTEKLKEQIVKAGAQGAIMKAPDPEAAAAVWAKRYPQYIDGAEEQQLARAAKTQARSNTLLAKQTEIADRQLATQNVDAKRNQIWADNVTMGPDGRPQIKPDFFKAAVALPAQYPNAPNAIETARTLLDWGESQQKPEKIESDPATVQSLTDRLFDADHPTTTIDLMKAQIDHKLSHQDFQNIDALVKELQQAPLRDRVWKDTTDAVKATLGTDATGRQNYAAFMQSFLPDYLRQKRAGTLPPSALDLKDQNSLISKAMAPYRRTQAQMLADKIAGNGGIQTNAMPQAPSAPAVGAVRSGYRFKGGDPSKPESWEKI